MEQFRIEAADDNRGYFFNIKPLGENRYEIYNDESERVGNIEIDGKDHEHCHALDCQIDLPLLHSIKEGILMHDELNKR